MSLDEVADKELFDLGGGARPIEGERRGAHTVHPHLDVLVPSHDRGTCRRRCPAVRGHKCHLGEGDGESEGGSTRDACGVTLR